MKRPALPFASVNRRDRPGYEPGLQRHHLLPRQLLALRWFQRMADRICTIRRGFHDFRENGMLLPSCERVALRTGLPLHRGPHRLYNELVVERAGGIEAGWRQGRASSEVEVVQRISLLQRALRRRLLAERRGAGLLNLKDPLRAEADFALLDALTDDLWTVTD
ncbi:AHH domain-containing protein [Novosphingobium tardum]|uniref:AHH domain-containing protein n=1 Tax=Novosphingobium tardum TaxID=1538021 RepID=A0ABV8RSQ5_9SPHN